MEAKDHHEYEIEFSKLKEVLLAISKFIMKPVPESLGGGDAWANHILYQRFKHKKDSYRQIIKDPYFGRFDFETNKNESILYRETGFGT